MNWVRRLIGQRRLERDLDAELRYHFDRLVEDQVRDGVAESEARRRARLQFGGLEQVREECRDARGTRWVETIVQDARFAVRQLRRAPVFTTVAIAVLAIGIGANTAVFTVVNGVPLRPMPFPGAEQLMLVSYKTEGGPFHTPPGISEREYIEVRDHNRSFERMATFANGLATLTGVGEPTRIQSADVSPEFFRVLRVAPALGRDVLPGDTEAVALISDSLWRARFSADPRIVGGTVRLDGVPRTVIGVMPPGFGFPNRSDVWIPLQVRVDPHRIMLRPVVGRLKAGVAAAAARAEVQSICGGLEPRTQNEQQSTASVLPLQELLIGQIRKPLLVFAGAVAFVLLIACANVANLLMIRAPARRQELAVRSALGAKISRLFAQLLTESALLSVLAGIVGVLFAYLGVKALLVFLPPGRMPRADQIRMDATVLAFTLGISVVTGLVFGLAPAYQLAFGATPRQRVRDILAAAEIALALILLTGAGLMVKSFVHMRAVDPGFRPDHVWTMTIDLPDTSYPSAASMRQFHRAVLDKLAAEPGVVASGAVNWRPLGGALIRGDFTADAGSSVPRDWMPDKMTVSPGYFRTMGIRLLSGRDFTHRDDERSRGVAIVSRSVARRLWPDGSAVGRRIALTDQPSERDWLEVIGIVDDVRQESVRDQPDPAVYQPFLQVAYPFFLGHMNFVVRSAPGDRTAVAAMQRVVREIDKELPVETVSSMNEVIAATTAEPLFQTRLLAVFSILALVMAIVGIYGVLTSAVAERTHEIGIRMALGGTTADIAALVGGRAAQITAAGAAVGVGGAFVLTRALGNMLFEVKPTDPATFAAVTLILAGIAIAAAMLPARRAARVDPAIALRHE